MNTVAIIGLILVAGLLMLMLFRREGSGDNDARTAHRVSDNEIGRGD